MAIDGSWGVGEILHVGKHRIFWRCKEDGMEYNCEIYPPEFRPIRSPEDVEMKKERSEECDRIFGILSGVERTGNRSDMAEALYDAGYRKME